MDEHSLDIKRNGTIIGMLQWHPGRESRILLNHLHRGSPYLTLGELQQCSGELCRQVTQLKRSKMGVK